MNPLEPQILILPRREVNIPRPIDIMNLRRPDVTAAILAAVFIHGPPLAVLQPVQRPRPRQLDVLPRRRHEVVVAIMVHDERIAPVLFPQRIGVCPRCCGVGDGEDLGYAEEQCQEREEGVHGGWMSCERRRWMSLLFSCAGVTCLLDVWRWLVRPKRIQFILMKRRNNMDHPRKWT
jgi:hypothetical protein